MSRHLSPMRPPCRTQTGFTLLEMILAAAITGIVALALFSSMRVAFDARRRAVDELSGRDTVRALRSIIRKDLEAVPAPTGIMAGAFLGEDGSASTGHDSDILIYTTYAGQLPTPDDLPDARIVTLRLVDDPDAAPFRMLVREVVTNPLAVVEVTSRQVLARRCVGFNARYYDGTDWLADWDSVDLEDALPFAIEVTLSIQPELERTPADTRVGIDDEQLLTSIQVILLPAAPPNDGSGSDGRISF